MNISSVLEAELDSPPFRGLISPCLSFPIRPTSFEMEFKNSGYNKTSEERCKHPKEKIYIYIYIIDDSVFAADFCIGSDAVFFI
jgi:hypothetical protein